MQVSTSLEGCPVELVSGTEQCERSLGVLPSRSRLIFRGRLQLHYVSCGGNNGHDSVATSSTVVLLQFPSIHLFPCHSLHSSLPISKQLFMPLRLGDCGNISLQFILVTVLLRSFFCRGLWSASLLT